MFSTTVATRLRQATFGLAPSLPISLNRRQCIVQCGPWLAVQAVQPNGGYTDLTNRGHRWQRTSGFLGDASACTILLVQDKLSAEDFDVTTHVWAMTCPFIPGSACLTHGYPLARSMYILRVPVPG